MPDKHRWLVSEIRARGFAEPDCYKEDTVAVLVRADHVRAGHVVVFYACWFERRWYLGSCARLGVTYLLPEGGDVVEACVEWAAGWARTPPEASFGAEAPPEVVTRFGLHQLSRAEIKAWFDAMAQAVKRYLNRHAGEP